MPGYRGHLVGGAFIYILALVFFKLLICMPSHAQLVEWLCFALAGALFPDIDTKSKGQKLFYYIFGGVLLLLFAQKRYTLCAIFGILCIVPHVVRHRGIFHKPFFIIALCATVALYVRVALPALAPALIPDMVFFVLGAFSHIWLDRNVKSKSRFS